MGERLKGSNASVPEERFRICALLPKTPQSLIFVIRSRSYYSTWMEPSKSSEFPFTISLIKRPTVTPLHFRHF